MSRFGQRWQKLSAARKTTVVLVFAASLVMIMSRILPVSVSVSGTLWVISFALVVGAAVFSLRRG